MEKIFSLIVTYNPDILILKELVVTLLKQTSYIVVCNNSIYNIEIDNSLVKIINFNENLGIAQAQSIGMKWAFENGADFILQMDQDSIPENDMVEKLKKCYRELTEEGYNIGLVGPVDYDKDTYIKSVARIDKGEYIKENYLSVSSTLSSGSLIPFKVYKQVGFMDDILFIDAVDSEYCWRLRDNGFLVIRNNEAMLSHKLGYGHKTVLGFIKMGISSPFRNYFQVRNVFLLLPRNYVPLYWKLSQLLKVVFKVLFYPILLPEGKKRLYFLYRGLFDGLRGVSGPYSEQSKKGRNNDRKTM